LMIYGLIVMLNGETARAFAMVSAGIPVRELRDRLDMARRQRFREHEFREHEDYDRIRDDYGERASAQAREQFPPPKTPPPQSAPTPFPEGPEERFTPA